MKPEEKPLLGTIITLDAPELAELAGLVGYDWVMVDMEHSTLGLKGVQRIIQAVNGRCRVVVRLPENTPVWVKRVLETGCNGIMLPMVNNATEAESAVKAAKYPPAGHRSVGISRAHGYGLNFEEYLANANNTTLVLAQIEHIDAVSRLGDILEVAGIDGVFIGPYDLSGSMNLLGQVGHAKVQAAIKAIKAKCAEHGMPYGIFGASPAALKAEIEEGCKYVLSGIDVLLLGKMHTQNLQELKGYLTS